MRSEPDTDGQDRGLPVLPVADREVADAVAAGDEVVVAALVRRLTPGLLRAAMSYTGSYAVAEEVVQDTWVAVLRSISAYEGRSSLSTWIYRICVHGAIRRATSERRSTPFADAFATDHPSTDLWADVADARDFPRGWSSPPSSWRELPEDKVVDDEARDVISAAVGSLPERQRRVLVLRDVEGYTADEVCDLLELSDANQRVLLHRARAHVRATLETRWEAS